MPNVVAWIKDNRLALSMTGALVVNAAFANVVNIVQPNRDISDKYYCIITPPGWAFAIWGVIYVSQLASCVTLFLPWTKALMLRIVDWKFFGLWASLCAAQSVWSIVFYHHQSVAAAILVWAFLSLVALQSYALRRLAVECSAADTKEPITGIRRYAAYAAAIAPYSINCGWVAAAVSLNVNVAGISQGRSAEWQLATAVCSLLFNFGVSWTLGVFGSPLAFYESDPALTGAVAWALYAVSKHKQIPPTTTVAAALTFPEGSLVPEALSTVSTVAASVLVAAQVVRLACNVARRHAGVRCGEPASNEVPLMDRSAKPLQQGYQKSEEA